MVSVQIWNKYYFFISVYEFSNKMDIASKYPSKLLSLCRFNFRTFRWMQTMIFAIEEINRNATVLPNITLGYKIYDSCSTPHQGLKAAIDLMGSRKDLGSGGAMPNKGTCYGAISAVIGDGGSTQSLVVARFLGVFHVPQVSYSHLTTRNMLNLPQYYFF